MVTILEALEQAKVDYLKLAGIVGLGKVDNTLIFYVETLGDVGKVPVTYLGFNTQTKVVGKVKML